MTDSKGSDTPPKKAGAAASADAGRKSRASSPKKTSGATKERPAANKQRSSGKRSRSSQDSLPPNTEVAHIEGHPDASHLSGSQAEAKDPSDTQNARNSASRRSSRTGSAHDSGHETAAAQSAGASRRGRSRSSKKQTTPEAASQAQPEAVQVPEGGRPAAFLSDAVPVITPGDNRDHTPAGPADTRASHEDGASSVAMATAPEDAQAPSVSSDTGAPGPGAAKPEKEPGAKRQRGRRGSGSQATGRTAQARKRSSGTAASGTTASGPASEAVSRDDAYPASASAFTAGGVPAATEETQNDQSALSSVDLAFRHGSSTDARPEIPVSEADLEAVQLGPEALIPPLEPAPVSLAWSRERGVIDLTPRDPLPADDASLTAADPASPEPEASESAADFPTSFGDLSPEDVFESLEAGESKDGEGGGRRRRSRGRRGRGRKKTAPGAENAAQQLDSETEAVDEEEPGISAHKPRQHNTPETDEESEAEAKAARRKMFVSVLPGEQVEVVIAEEGQVLEYYVEMLHQAKTKGNIYKGVIHNVDPNLQAAFVSYGAVKNGFLQIDEVHPEYYNVAHEAEKGRKYPPIQKVLKAGQEVLVQIVKEPAGTKGAFLTTYLSLPGRYLVLTPGREQIGVSRKVDNEKERARLRELLEGLTPGQGLGVIVRTVSMGASKTNLQRDLQFLKRTWKEVRTRGTSEKAPCLIYQEQDLTARAIRDYLTESIGEVWVDDEKTAEEVSEIATALFPRKQNLVRIHKEDSGTSLFERFNLQRQLDQIHSRDVSLPSGGRLVIDPTEALTAIDINSGRSGGKNNFEDMAYRTNMEAARMIPLQLRLRDIGGQVVADFIEMRDKSHWREVEKTLRNGMKVDRARYDVGKIGPFGLLEIVRQRLGSSAISVSTEPCPCCNGSGIRRNMEWQSQRALRDILRALRVAQSQKQESINYTVDPELALHLLNHKRQRLLEMERSFGISVTVDIKKPE